ncbi:MAG: helix-turn-helix transcriptional regulator [Micromonosporaceae bacterium]|nr:helix-turn-helix transcriptional regulator [Micromonosporaceae bacterium]
MATTWEPSGVGKRIRAFRQRRGLTQEVVAGLVGRSVSWLRQVEAGNRYVDSLSMIFDLARVLHCEPTELIGRALLLAPGRGGRVPESVPAIRAAIMAPDLATTGNGVSPQEIATGVRSAWHDWHHSRHAYSDVASVLPALITDARRLHRTVETDQRAEATAVLANVYHLARLWLKKVGEYELAIVASDRALALAQQTTDPVTLALSAWSVTGVLNSTGHPEEGILVASEAIGVLTSTLETAPERVRALYGQLHLVRAISLARNGEDGAAWQSWDTADEVARSLPAGYVEPVTRFGVANVGAHTVAIPAELGQAKKATDAAERLDVTTLPSVERRSRYLLDVARGFVGQREDVAAFHVLTAAERESTEELQYSVLAAELARELLSRSHGAIRHDVQDMARRLGVLPE